MVTANITNNGGFKQPKDRTDLILRILRLSAALNAPITVMLAVYNSPSVRDKIPIKPLSMPLVIDVEVWFQTFTILCLIGFVLRSLPNTRPDEWVEDDTPLVNRMFAGIAIDERKARLRNVWDSSRQFWLCWVGLWFVWFGLYFNWALHPPTQIKVVNAYSILADLFNMLTAGAFFLCYLVLSRRTTPSQQFEFPQMTFFTLVPVGLLGLSAVFFVGKPLSTLEPLHWFEGLLSAIVLALFIGRLESGFLNSNPYLIAALYAYAAIQVSYGSLQKEWLLLVVTSLALVLKVLLFQEMRRLMHSGTLFWYMFEFRKMLEATPDDDIAIVSKNHFLDAIGMTHPTNIIPFGRPRGSQPRRSQG